MATTKRTKVNLEFLLVKGVVAEPQHWTGGFDLAENRRSEKVWRKGDGFQACLGVTLCRLLARRRRFGISQIRALKSIFAAARIWSMANSRPS